MARRKQSVFEALMEIAAMLPWWLDVVLAVVAYFALHHFAIMEIVVTGNTKDVGSALSNSIIKGAATAFQYILPVVFVAGALMSAFGRRKRNALHSQVATAAPVCPQCGSAMIMKIARKGANAGGSFWGCPQFPKCHGTRPA